MSTLLTGNSTPVSYWQDVSDPDYSRDGWSASIRLACDWIIERSLITTRDHGFEGCAFMHRHEYSDWRGAFRGEYNARTKHWDFFCPIWHGGQGVKALTLASQTLQEEEYLHAARSAADFILRHQIRDASDEDDGLILAYESASPGINTSAILETLDGLFALGEATGEVKYSDAAIAALRWVQRKMFLPDDGLFVDDYDPHTRAIGCAEKSCGRPLLDDGVFLKGYALTGDKSMLTVAVRTADRLLEDEYPLGNWIDYPPASRARNTIHPRHAFWWGRPMAMLHRATGETKYLECCRRSAQWYTDAMRSDGGLFRDTNLDSKTSSFGHATSGIACAAILWHDLIVGYNDHQWREPLRTALKFCRSMQFTDAQDANLHGAILEKVLPPCGTDAPPWYLRDIGTFFFVQAACRTMDILASL
jgi:hypothetical protein